MRSVTLSYLLILSSTSFAQGIWQSYTMENSPLLSNQVSSIIVDRHNNLWGAYAGAGGSGLGVVLYDGSSWTHYNTANSGLPNNDIRSIAVDRLDNVWFACYNAGIVKFDGTSWTAYNATNSSIAGNDAVTIQFDRYNNLWVGCYFSGISKYDGIAWKTYTTADSPFPASNCISALSIDRDNNIWVGMDCAGGLATLNTTTNIWTSFTTSNSQIGGHTVRTILQDGTGTLWMSHLQNIISSFDGTNWVQYNLPKYIYGFSLDPEGNLWGCGQGLFKFNGASWDEVLVDGAEDNYSFEFGESLAIDFSGRIWWTVQSKGIWTNGEIISIPPNTPPAFAIPTIINTEEDFENFTVQLVPATVPLTEQNQTVLYSLEALSPEKALAIINPISGEITFNAIKDSFGIAHYKVTADDGQGANNIFTAMFFLDIDSVNDAPTLSMFEDVEVELNEVIEPILFTIQDVDHPLSDLLVSASSSNQLLVGDSNIIIEGDGNERILNITTEANILGEATITVTLEDPGLKAERQFKLTVFKITGADKLLENKIKLFPNPVSSNLVVLLEEQGYGPLTIIISDITGQEVGKFSATSNAPVIDLTKLQPGLYTVRVADQNKVSKPYKIVKGN